jgi:hypothetical protein
MRTGLPLVTVNAALEAMTSHMHRLGGLMTDVVDRSRIQEWCTALAHEVIAVGLSPREMASFLTSCFELMAKGNRPVPPPDLMATIFGELAAQLERTVDA